MVFILLFNISIGMAASSKDFADPTYKVSEEYNKLKFVFPWADKALISDPAFEHLPHYELSFHLDRGSSIANGSFGNSSSSSGSMANNSNVALNEPKENESTREKELPEIPVEELLAIANDYYKEGEFDAALAYVNEALRVDTKSLRALKMKGSLFHAKKEPDAAKVYWQKALELDPNDSELKKLIPFLKTTM